MRKLKIVGILSLLLLGLCIPTVSIASNGIQASLFPIKLIFNGKEQSVSKEYKVLNVDGHTYLPARFIVEKMEGGIKYNSKNKTIEIDYLSPSSPIYSDEAGYYPEVKVGNLKITKKGNQSLVSGSFTVFGAKDDHGIGYTLDFFDKDGKNLGSVNVAGNVKKGHVTNFEEKFTGDLTSYETVTMELALFDEIIHRPHPKE